MSIFADIIFINLCLLLLTYSLPIHHMFYWENNIMAKYQLNWTINVLPIGCWENYKRCCIQNSRPRVIFIKKVWEMLKFRTNFPRTWWIQSNTVLEMVFTEVLGLSVIPYSASTMDILNLWRTNYFPWSYVISIGLGYIESHGVSTMFATYISFVSSYCAISNHPVTWSIIVTSFRCNFSFFTHLFMT